MKDDILLALMVFGSFAGGLWMMFSSMLSKYDAKEKKEKHPPTPAPKPTPPDHTSPPTPPTPAPKVTPTHNSFRSGSSHRFIVPDNLDKKRLEKARTEYMYFPYGVSNKENRIITKKGKYYVTLYTCSCDDKQKRHVKHCKHMYRLWIERGYLK